MNQPTPQEVESKKLYAEMGMSDAEYQMAKDILKRQPNYTEIGLFSVMWSEHCSYKNSKVLLRGFPTKGERILVGPGEGAGIVDIGDNQAVVFKIESHNHPSAVEPFDGAATGVGGIVRDVFSMGARPIASLNSLRFGELDKPNVKHLFKEVVKGVAFYGNGVGVPTVGGEVYFDPCYEGNPLVNAMVVGVLNHEDIKKGQAHGEGNIVMYAGADTDRSGVHGASFASKEFDGNEKEAGTNVPKGDPFLEKRLIEACLEVMKHPALVGIQDMGAAGLISSSCEMASKAGMGMEMNLDLVPQSAANMIPYEMMLSETQERMLLVVQKGREEEIRDIFKKYDINAVDVGTVTNDKNMRIFHKSELVADVPADALALQAPEYNKPQKEAEYFAKFQKIDVEVNATDANQTLLDLLAQPTIASKKYAYEQFDHQARGNTLVPPGSDAGVVQIEGTNKAVAMTTDCNGRYVYLNPYVGGQIAVAESARNIIASGGLPLAVTDNLNFGSPENPEIFWQMAEACKGISYACAALDTPVIGGNVSMYNERSGTAIYPTPIIGMVGLIEDLSHVTTQHFKNAGDLIYLIGETLPEFGGSELQKMQNNNEIEGRPPIINMETEKANGQMILQLIKSGLIKSAHDIAEGGIAVALAESLFTEGNLGAKVDIALEDPALLFSESQSRYIVSISPEHCEPFELAFKNTDVPVEYLGLVNDSGQLEVVCDITCMSPTAKRIEAINQPVKSMRERFEGAIPCLLK